MIKINFRPLFVGFVSLIFGIIVYTYFFSSINAASIAVLILYLTVNACAIVFFGLSFVQRNNNFWHFVKKIKGIMLTLLITFVVCTLVNSLQYVACTNSVVKNTSEVTMSGVISDTRFNERYAEITVNDLTFNKNKVGGKVIISFTFGENVDVSAFKEGNIINLTSNVSKLNYNFENMSYINDNVKYECNTSINEILVLEGNASFKTQFKNGVFANLKTVLNAENAAIAYSMLFGEKDYLSNDVYNVFSYSGLAHILAVSGLHIGFLVSFIVLLLKLFKCNKHLKVVLVFIILLFYAYLTNFTPSVLRALIMSMVLLIAKTYNKEYDSLSSLSLAGIIILVLRPSDLFSIGFQLSFACVFAIITLSNQIGRMLIKIKLPKIFANGLAISVAVNLGVMAITAVHFNNLNFISVFSNIVVLPLFSICYVLLFLFAIVAFIPFMQLLLFVPNIMLHFIKLIANFFANINFLQFEIFHLSYVVVFLTLLALFIAKFLITNFSVKSVMCSVLIVAVLLTGIITNLPARFNNFGFMLRYSRYGNTALFTTEQNERVLFVSNLVQAKQTINMLNEHKVNKIDAIVAYNFSVKDTDEIATLIKKYNIDNLFVNKNFEHHIINSFSNIVITNFVTDECNVFGLQCNFINGINKTHAVNITVNGKTVLMFSELMSKQEIINTSFSIYDKVDYVISNNNNVNFLELGIQANNYVLHRFEQTGGNVILLKNDLHFTNKF